MRKPTILLTQILAQKQKQRNFYVPFAYTHNALYSTMADNQPPHSVTFYADDTVISNGDRSVSFQNENGNPTEQALVGADRQTLMRKAVLICALLVIETCPTLTPEEKLEEVRHRLAQRNLIINEEGLEDVLLNIFRRPLIEAYSVVSILT